MGSFLVIDIWDMMGYDGILTKFLYFDIFGILKKYLGHYGHGILTKQVTLHRFWSWRC